MYPEFYLFRACTNVFSLFTSIAHLSYHFSVGGLKVEGEGRGGGGGGHFGYVSEVKSCFLGFFFFS